MVILDVRSAGEYNGPSGHIRGAIHLPLQEITRRPGMLEQSRDRQIVTVCLTGRRSRKAAEILLSKGYAAMNLSGGMSKWIRLKYPVEKNAPLP